VTFATLLSISILLWRKRTRNVAEIPAYLDSYWDMLKERRRTIRYEKHLPVFCSVPEHQGDKYRIFSKDISGEGVCIQLPEMLPEGSILDLEINIPESSSVLVRGEVVWVTVADSDSTAKGGERAFTAGIRFTKVDIRDKKRLNSFLEGGDEA